MRIIYYAVVLCFSFVLAVSLLAEQREPSAVETGSIRGQIANEAGRPEPVENATVFICDAVSGMPILTTTKRELDSDRLMEGMKHFWFAVSDKQGRFEFDDVPIGKYRLVAQSWKGAKGMPLFQGEPGTVLVLHGISEKVSVKANDVTQIKTRKLGNEELKIVTDPEAPHNFLLISQKPQIGDAVLGPVGWGPGFISGLIGVTRMEKPFVTLTGLPDGEQIHVGLMNYDNNPGMGGDSYTVGRDKVVRLKIYATWSTGKYEPPKRLEKLTEHLEKKDVSVSSLLGLKGKNANDNQVIIDLMKNDYDRIIEVEGIGKFRVADVLAASRYQELREFHRKRRARK